MGPLSAYREEHAGGAQWWQTHQMASDLLSCRFFLFSRSHHVSPPPQSAARQVIDIMKCGVRQGTKPAVERCGTRGKHEDEPVLMKTAGGFAGMVEKMEKRQQTTFRMHIDLP